MVHSNKYSGGKALVTISEWFQLSTVPTNAVSKEISPLERDTHGKSTQELAGRDDKDTTSSVSTRVDDDTTIDRTPTFEEPEELSHLDWRMNAKASLSDWTIVITTPSIASQYYHVHRSIMMLPCKYFRKVFKKHRRLSDGRSDFYLQDKAADAFPQFLDYVYHLANPLMIITRDNVVPLYFLSRVFMVDRLRWQTRQFWEKDMTVETIAEYYRLAITFEEEPLMDRVVKACIDEPGIFAGLDSEAEILFVANPRLLLHMVKNGGSDKENSEHLSRLVAKFCALHPTIIDSGTFTALTLPLSAVAMEVACQLLIQEQGYSKEQNLRLSSLQKCCILALAKHWPKLDITTPEFQKMLATQSSLFLGELFQKTIMAVKGLLTEYDVQSPQWVDDEDSSIKESNGTTSKQVEQNQSSAAHQVSGVVKKASV